MSLILQLACLQDDTLSKTAGHLLKPLKRINLQKLTALLGRFPVDSIMLAQSILFRVCCALSHK